MIDEILKFGSYAYLVSILGAAIYVILEGYEMLRRDLEYRDKEWHRSSLTYKSLIKGVFYTVCPVINSFATVGLVLEKFPTLVDKVLRVLDTPIIPKKIKLDK